MSITATGPPTDDEKAALKAVIADETEFPESAIGYFSISAVTVDAQLLRRRRLSAVIWDVSFSVTTTLAFVAEESRDDLALSLAETLRSDAFESALKTSPELDAVVLSVDGDSIETFVQTRNPSSFPTRFLVDDAALHDRGDKDNEDSGFSQLVDSASSAFLVVVSAAALLLLFACAVAWRCLLYHRSSDPKGAPPSSSSIEMVSQLEGHPPRRTSEFGDFNPLHGWGDDRGVERPGMARSAMTADVQLQQKPEAGPGKKDSDRESGSSRNWI